MRDTNRTTGRTIVWVLVAAALVIGVVIFGGEDPGDTADAPLPEPTEMVDVTFTSDPSGASLFIDGGSKGNTPITVSVPKGEPTRYRLNATDRVADYDLYEPYRGTLTPTEDTAIDVWITRTTAEQQAEQREAAEAERARREREREAAARERASEELLDAEMSVRRTCRDIVKRQLRAPSTAEFPGLFSGAWDYRVNAAAGVAFYSSHVDAQNGFGAMIRNTFMCSYEADSGTVTLLSLE